MGLPEMLIDIKAAARTAVTRSGRGVVALILRDSTSSASASESYANMAAVKKTAWTAANYDYIQKTFDGSPSKVIVERIGTDGQLSDALALLKNKRWNYLAMPAADEGEVTELSTWIKNMRAAHKSFKAVLPDCAANNAGIINFAGTGITVGKKSYTAAEYCARIAGILAGTALDNSATYAVLPEVDSITESTDPDKDINEGKLILINDGENIKLGRAVNSLTTLSENMTEDMKKIKIIDGLDLICDDIRDSFEKNYIGTSNSYDNKLLFINAVNVYFAALERDGVLYDEYENTAFIDTDAQRAYLEGIDAAYAEYTDDEIKRAATGSHIFAGGQVKLQDAIEDMKFTIYL